MNSDTAAQVNARHALKLRVVRHKYAARRAAHARAMERHAHMLVRLHARINTESDIAIAGPAYEEYHTVPFDTNGSMPSSSRTPTPVAWSRAPALQMSWPTTWPIAQAKSPLAPARCRLSVGVWRALSPSVSIYTCFGIYTSPRTRTCILLQASFNPCWSPAALPAGRPPHCKARGGSKRNYCAACAF